MGDDKRIYGELGMLIPSYWISWITNNESDNGIPGHIETFSLFILVYRCVLIENWY